MKSGLKIGVLAVQGAFIEHKRMLESLGCECVELRKKSDICDIDGLVLPGGESTVQGKLLRELDMFDELKGRIANGLPVLATCAGLILLSATMTTYISALCLSLLKEMPTADSLEALRLQQGLTIASTLP